MDFDETDWLGMLILVMLIIMIIGLGTYLKNEHNTYFQVAKSFCSDNVEKTIDIDYILLEGELILIECTYIDTVNHEKKTASFTYNEYLQWKLNQDY